MDIKNRAKSQEPRAKSQESRIKNECANYKCAKLITDYRLQIIND
jgi:hypothetical protein